DAKLVEPPAKPATFIVFPGIFGEFVTQVPFQPIFARDSIFRRKWRAALARASDDSYSLVDMADQPCSLADLVPVASVDQDGRSLLNVMALRINGGSLETLGSLAGNAAVFERRLAKVFEVVDDDSDIYLVGYSRGLAVALELVSTLHARTKSGTISPASARWFERVRGVVSLAGVYYGSGFAGDVLAGNAGATSDLVKLLADTAHGLETVPEKATARERLRVIRKNAQLWAALMKRMTAAKGLKLAAGRTFLGIDLADALMRETKERVRSRDAPLPNPAGIFSLVNNFFLETFRLERFASRYNRNVLAFRQLVDAVITGVESLTTPSRDAWWRTHELPEDLVLFSLTGIMPEAYLGDLKSPLAEFDGFGAQTSDYNVSLRAGYYDTLASEGTLINDSQMSHFGSRYWEGMYAHHQYGHYYLGVLGTHHWGIALPFAIKDKAAIGGNAFPRETMLKSIASFIASFDR
ncbi:MAG TPA: hypothetical protein VJS69_02565, partial [Candidatus Krumholzibacteria bacterium]|nr:hypothetical protein [Candidatus Krumholzibacteria bacterium]